LQKGSLTSAARYFIALWPLFALVTAAGILQLRGWPRAAATVVTLYVGVGLYATLFGNFTINLGGSQALFPIQHVAAALQTDRAQNGDIVVHYLPDSNRVVDNFTYSDITWLYYSLTHASAVTAMGWQRPRNEKSLIDKIRNKGRVWIAYLPNDRPVSLDVLIDDMADDFSFCGSLTDHPDVAIDLYARNDIPCPDNPGLYLDGRAPG
jgi:hypothetical protein